MDRQAKAKARAKTTASAFSVQRKALRHLALGAREVWLISPDEQSAELYRSLPQGYQVVPLSIDQSLEGGRSRPTSACRCAIYSMSVIQLREEKSHEQSQRGKPEQF